MSRFAAWLESLQGAMDWSTPDAAFARMLERLHADEGRAGNEFTFFLRERAPARTRNAWTT